MSKCFVCGKRKIDNPDFKYKLCGMRLDNTNYIKENNFIFCCTKCSDKFRIILKSTDLEETEEVLQKNVTI